jgi:hypothetical protein
MVYVIQCSELNISVRKGPVSGLFYGKSIAPGSAMANQMGCEVRKL